jgi:hypothetical protein
LDLVERSGCDSSRVPDESLDADVMSRSRPA